MEFKEPKLFFKNFSGLEMPYNKWGNRNFCITFSDDISEKMKEDGLIVKTTKGGINYTKVRIVNTYFDASSKDTISPEINILNHPELAGYSLSTKCVLLDICSIDCKSLTIEKLLVDSPHRNSPLYVSFLKKIDVNLGPVLDISWLAKYLEGVKDQQLLASEKIRDFINSTIGDIYG